jgi:hypothetical protein
MFKILLKFYHSILIIIIIIIIIMVMIIIIISILSKITVIFTTFKPCRNQKIPRACTINLFMMGINTMAS